jgi:small-conductance mechanosensitive channel
MSALDTASQLFARDVAAALHAFATDELWRLTATLLVLFGTPLVLRFVKRHLSDKSGSLAQRRERHVIWRNAVIMLAAVAVVSVWASKIAGFALSLAAVAGAVLIVSKEALLNILGFLAITVLRPFKFGDYVETGAYAGRVVDINAMCTILVETRAGHQVTGATVTIPNAAVLTQPVRNVTVTGEFVVYLVTVRVPRGEDAGLHEAALLEAATTVCGAWIEQATAWLDRLEAVSSVDLPSAQPRVLLALPDGKHLDLSLRYTCRPNDRVKVEQQILRLYLQAVRTRQPAAPATAQPAEPAEADADEA